MILLSLVWSNTPVDLDVNLLFSYSVCHVTADFWNLLHDLLLKGSIRVNLVICPANNLNQCNWFQQFVGRFIVILLLTFFFCLMRFVLLIASGRSYFSLLGIHNFPSCPLEMYGATCIYLWLYSDDPFFNLPFQN